MLIVLFSRSCSKSIRKLFVKKSIFVKVRQVKHGTRMTKIENIQSGSSLFGLRRARQNALYKLRLCQLVVFTQFVNLLWNSNRKRAAIDNVHIFFDTIQHSVPTHPNHCWLKCLERKKNVIL